ncbi:hypothetical protein HY503_00635 [Candidatus Woesebacteria bacterium]|nr:hypothetical protein [Candidatus Woesebacteria bacterium]
MSKRRTRAEKEKAHHTFLYSWQGEPKKEQLRHDVKGQFKIEPKPASNISRKAKNANLMAKDDSLAWVKRDMVKSLILASLILAAEVVVYLAWF